MNPIDIYAVILLLSLSALATAAFALWSFCMPKEIELRNIRAARKLLVIAYVIIVVADVASFISGIENESTFYFLSYTLIVASLQAFLFTRGLVTLIPHPPVGKKKQIYHLVPILLFSTMLLAAMFAVPRAVFMLFFYSCLILYMLQLAYYVFWFLKEFNDYRDMLNNYFSDDEASRMLWIKRSFFMALGIGIISMIALFMPLFLYSLYVMLFTVFYVYFAAKIINYTTAYQYLSFANHFAEANKNGNLQTQPQGNSFVESLDIWVNGKQFVNQGITLKSLASELCTNQTYLSNHVNTTTGQSFRNWISRLRIEEAQQLLNMRPDIPVSCVGEMVGIPNKSSFFRQFINVTGKTPRKYRDDFACSANENIVKYY